MSKTGSARVCLMAAIHEVTHGSRRICALPGATQLLKMYCLVRTWRLAAGLLSKVIDLPRRTLAAAALAAAHVRHRGGAAGASGPSGSTRLGHSSHSVTKWSLACMSTCRSRPAPELTNLCATPAGITTTCPPFTSITSSPAVKVALPSCTTKTSS